MKKIILSIVLVNLLAACASQKQKEAVDEPAATPAVAEAPAATAAEAAIPEVRSVYFPFDVDVVQAADRAAIQAHGAYLGKNNTAKVRVEGNADERGSSEYNLALGQRRANNVKKLLILSGAKASQIETVSYGEEKPRATGHDEASWSQNRRADIVYSTK
jgi:peptidoglycan-associated lipoprotein